MGKKRVDWATAKHEEKKMWDTIASYRVLDTDTFPSLHAALKTEARVSVSPGTRSEFLIKWFEVQHPHGDQTASVRLHSKCLDVKHCCNLNTE